MSTNITFLIGNGFDLHLGLKTSYKDMYQSYIEAEHEDNDIINLKQLLNEDAPSGYKTWGDFEMAMAHHSNSFKTEDSFIKCVRDFKQHMIHHLKTQDESFQNQISERFAENICSSELENSLKSYHAGLIPNIKYEINHIYEKYGPVKYRFIDFNYTSTLDRLLQLHSDYNTRNGIELIHIHGKLGADIVLGVDNEDQIQNKAFSFSRSLKRAFIKPQFNEMYDKQRVSQASDAILTSHIICVYGLSLGDSDRTWTIKLFDWLKKRSECHLIFFLHQASKKNELSQRDEIMDYEDDYKQELLERLLDDPVLISNVFDRVHIPIGYDIFNFKSVLDEQLPKKQELSKKLQVMSLPRTYASIE